jgi:GT2 family glycosyltransferase
MNIHVIISTYNGARWIEKCLTSIFASSIPLKVNLIDNASSDNTLDIVKKKFPAVDITPNYENRVREGKQYLAQEST